MGQLPQIFGTSVALRLLVGSEKFRGAKMLQTCFICVQNLVTFGLEGFRSFSLSVCLSVCVYVYHAWA